MKLTPAIAIARETAGYHPPVEPAICCANCGAFLLCERAAAERAAAERAAAERAAAETFELSPREIELQKTLGAAKVPRENPVNPVNPV